MQGLCSIFTENDIFAFRNDRWEEVVYDVTDDVEVYIGGVRLRKEWYEKYTNTLHPYSPEGDTIVNPDYKVNGKGYYIRLSKSIPKGVSVKIIKKTGKLWTNSGETLSTSDNYIARYVRLADAIWPQYLVDKYQYTVSTDSNFTLETDGNSSDILELD